MSTPWQKYVDELLQDTKNRCEANLQEKKMMEYLDSLLPEEISKVERKKARRMVRLMRR